MTSTERLVELMLFSEGPHSESSITGQSVLESPIGPL